MTNMSKGTISCVAARSYTTTNGQGKQKQVFENIEQQWRHRSALHSSFLHSLDTSKAMFRLMGTSTWQNQQKGMCFQRRLRSAWASESSLSAWRKLWSLATHWVPSKDSDQTGRMDAQADLGLRWGHMPFCRFCHALAHRCKFTAHTNSKNLVLLWKAQRKHSLQAKIQINEIYKTSYGKGQH